MKTRNSFSLSGSLTFDLEQSHVEKLSEELKIGEIEAFEIQSVIERWFSHVAKCEVKGSRRNKVIFIKVYKEGSIPMTNDIAQWVSEEYQNLNHWYEKFICSNRFFVAKPLLVIPDKGLLITEEIPGKNLNSLIKQRTTFFTSSRKYRKLLAQIRNVGAWVRYFQSLSPLDQRRFSVDEFITYINVRLKVLTEERNGWFPLHYKDQILGFFESHKNNLSERELRLSICHSDFNPGNVIVNGQQVTVFDFGKSQIDSSYLDISRVYHQLYLMTFKPYIRKKYITSLQKALLEGFGESQAENLLIFRFFLIRHTLTHLVTITRFWKFPIHEKLYNFWVLQKELSFVDQLLT